MSLEKCDKCDREFLSEADPYGCWNTNKGFKIYCIFCFEKIINDIKSRIMIRDAAKQAEKSISKWPKWQQDLAKGEIE